MGNLTMLLTLIERTDQALNPNMMGSVFFEATKHGQKFVFTFALQCGVNLNKKDDGKRIIQLLMTAAVRRGYVNVMKILLDNGPIIQTRVKTHA